VQGGLVLLKHKDSNGTPQTTLLEIDKVPEVDAPYRPYAIQYVAVDGSAKSMEECVAGVELLLEDASAVATVAGEHSRPRTRAARLQHVGGESARNVALSVDGGRHQGDNCAH
jgi:hypothetical protein